MAQRRVLKQGRNCWHIGDVSQTGVLVDARDYFRAFYHAAREADRYILLSGWQFDSNVALLRGKDAEVAAEDAPLLTFLNDLCERKPELRIYILAWDFSMFYSLDREWFQEWYFNWTTSERLKFCFDCCDYFDASHHQKYVVIDGIIAFVGGLDLCSGRWDERDHRADNPQRSNADETRYQPFHDIQAYHVGPVAQKLAEHFTARWECTGCEKLELPPAAVARQINFEPTVTIAATRMAISRTQTHGDNKSRVQEIRRLFLDAIDAAEELIYIENQYFSSKALYQGLVARMMDKSRPRLDIVLMIAKDADAFLEQISIGIAQEKLVRGLREIAIEEGHSLGIYYPASVGADGEEVATYIHSKLFLVDDRFLSIGSANMNNRSMGYDTELNVAWEGLSRDLKVIESIREVRVNLLAEHTGLDLTESHELQRTQGLVSYLNRLADDRACRLRHHPVESVSGQYPWVTSILPEGLPFDPEIPAYTEDVYEGMATTDNSFFTKGVTSLKEWLLSLGQASTAESKEQGAKS
jgi:phospholipase D1/2